MGKYIKSIGLEIALQAVLAAFESLALAGIAYIPKLFFDSIIDKEYGYSAVYIVLAYGALYAISLIAAYFGMRTNWRLSIKFENAVKADYFHAITQLDDIEFHKKTTSEYISIQSNDIMQLEQDYLTPMISAVNQIIKVIIYGLVMVLWVDWRIAAVVFVISLFAAVLPKYTGKPCSKKRLEFVNQLELYTEMVSDLLNGFRIINLRTENQIEKRHKKALDTTSLIRHKYGKSKANSLILNGIARTIVSIAGITMVVVFLFKGEITIGTGAAVLGFIDSFVGPLQETLYCFTMMETVKHVKDKVFAFIKDKGNSSKKVRRVLSEAIELKDVCAHQGGFYLDYISYRFEKGKHYAIIGSNGSGKSTLLHTLMGFLKKDQGEILIDGEQVENLNLSWLISFVPQKSHIFNADYLANVTVFGSYNNPNKENIEGVLPKRIIDTLAAQTNSQKLSGGEKQIVAYLRARNANTPILILDEPFSAVDQNTKHILMQDISRLEDKIIIMITHDINQDLKYFDEVIKVCEGTISA